MEVSKNNNPSERRGRFLIQEVEEENVSIDTSGTYLNIKNTNKNNKDKIKLEKKRSKHASILQDNKIIHLTHDNIEIAQPIFSTYIQSENNNWSDFEKIWNEFSKCHDDLSDCNIERIFNYNKIQSEQSDFFDNCQKLLQGSLAQGITTDTISSTIQFEYPLIPKKSLTMNIKENNTKIKDLDINFIEDNYIFSPSFSPIVNYNRTFSLDLSDFNTSNKDRKKERIFNSDNKHQNNKDKNNNINIAKLNKTKDLKLNENNNSIKIQQIEMNVYFTLNAVSKVKDNSNNKYNNDNQNNNNIKYSIISHNIELLGKSDMTLSCKCSL